MVGNIAWPHPKVVEIGSLLSTIGAGLQSLTGAPRLLQAISKDQIIPFLKPFETLSGKGEPVRALAITLVISEVAVLIGKDVHEAPKVHLLLFSFFLAQLLANFTRQEKTGSITEVENHFKKSHQNCFKPAKRAMLIEYV